MNGYTRQAVAARIGALPDLRDAATAAARFIMIPFEFGTVADNAASTKSRRISNAGPVAITAITGCLYTGSGAAVAFSEAVSLEFWTNNNGWQEDAVPWDALVGTGTQPMILPFQPVIPAGAEISAKLTNGGSGGSVVGRLVLFGVTIGR
jgi:hypothetical protein